ncbi:MAG TPA: hypothetical protein VJ963_05935 [Bacteroidales bacterium]|nr:hypothetical protein [Bacteroidales bacterium]
MKKIRKLAGITWAFAGLLLIVILFPGLTGLSGLLAEAPFMKIHPRYSGGEKAYEIVRDHYTLEIRKPVFMGLVKDRKEGFVQLDWRGQIPGVINDTIDYDRDGVSDFSISVDTASNDTVLRSYNEKVESTGISTRTSYGWAVRVNLKN